MFETLTQIVVTILFLWFMKWLYTQPWMCSNVAGGLERDSWYSEVVRIGKENGFSESEIRTMGLNRRLPPLQSLLAATEECGLSDGQGLFGQQCEDEEEE